MEITAILLGINFIVGIGLTILLLLLCERLGLSRAAAVAVTAGFMLLSTILRYIHSGMSYNLGFMLQIAALLLILHARRAPAWRQTFAALGGATLALSFAVWFPYILTVPSILLAAWFFNPSRGEAEPCSPTRTRVVAIGAFATTIIGLILFGIGACIDHLSSYDALKQWVVNSAHGVAPENRLARLPMGVTRSFLYRGDEGIALKRFVLGDIYAPVHVADLLPALLKVLIVFLAFGVVVLALMRNRKDWPALAILLSGVLPVVAFAVLLFETSEPARYEPAYPALLVAVSVVLLHAEAGRVYRLCLALFLSVIAAVNLTAYAWSLRATNSEVSARAVLAHDHTALHGITFLLSFRDPLSAFVQRFPLSPLNRQGALPLYHVIEVGTAKVDTWKRDAACRVLRARNEGGDAWLSDRLKATRPKPEWGWVERDDSRVHWSDVPDFFNRFEQDSHVGADDGFFRIAATPNNLEQLRYICAGPK